MANRNAAASCPADCSSWYDIAVQSIAEARRQLLGGDLLHRRDRLARAPARRRQRR